MYCLIGLKNDIYQEKIGGEFRDHYSKDIIATFSTKQQAEEYIKKSLLKQPVRNTFSSDKIFKSKSLLSGYESAYIEYYEEPFIEHDPEI